MGCVGETLLYIGMGVCAMAQWLKDAELVTWKADSLASRPERHVTE